MAFKFSIENIQVPEMFLWTVTTLEAEDVKTVKLMWHNVTSGKYGLVNSFPAMSGLRVFEMHPGTELVPSHGLHIHFVTDKRLPVDIVRVITNRAGFGRIHVKAIPGHAAFYLGKYLRKADRPECLKGCQMWRAFGAAEGSKVKDIIIDNEFSQAYRFIASMVKNWKDLRFEERMAFTTLFASGASLEEAFDSINYTPTNNPGYALAHIQERNQIREHDSQERRIAMRRAELLMADAIPDEAELKRWADWVDTDGGKNPF